LIDPNPNKTCIQRLSKAIGKTLSSYTQAINKQNNTVGNLFTKKTKTKCLTDSLIINPKYNCRDYLVTCFNYVHLNPTKAGLVKSLHEWPYSSWLDYAGFRNGTLCNKELGMRLTGLRERDFQNDRRIILFDDILEEIW
jgi:putative transposase